MKRSLPLAVMLAAACGSKPSEFPVGLFGADTRAKFPNAVWSIEDEPGAASRRPPESAGDRVRAMVEAAGGREVWAVLKTAGRPARPEIRFMSYDAVLNGAGGIWYIDSQEDSAAAEMRAMAPVFARGRPIPLPFEAPEQGLRARAWTYHGRDYLVLVNRARDRQWKIPDEVLAPAWRPLFEARRDPRELLKEHRGAYYLRPYQVLALESRLRPKRLLGR